MVMDIRKLTADDFEDSIALFQYAFQYVLTEERKEQIRSQFGAQDTWGIFEEGQLGANLQIIPFHTYIHGKAFAMGGIAGVSTWPEYRRKGLVAQLLRHSLEEMNHRKQSISFLHPFSFAFYRKYGWETYVEFKRYHIPVTHLPAKKATPGSVRRGMPALDVLDSVYQTYAKRYNGTLVREKNRWDNSVLRKNAGQRAVYYDADDQPQGYILYEVKDRKFAIGEMVCLNEEAKQGLWTFIANHDSMIEEVTLQAPASDDLAFRLDNPRIQQEIVPYFMARIVSVEQFVLQYPFADLDSPIRLMLQVQDEHASWNEGVWELNVALNGTASIWKSSAETAADGQDVKVSIQTLTAMLLGYKRPLELLAMGRIEGNTESVAALDRAIPNRETYLLDFF